VEFDDRSQHLEEATIGSALPRLRHLRVPGEHGKWKRKFRREDGPEE
jgi:hypothetical protein